jgi:hypothetical protein
MTSCPCGLIKEELIKLNFVENQRCIAIYELNGTEFVCGKLYTSHPVKLAPLAPPGNKPHPLLSPFYDILFVLSFLIYLIYCAM